MRTITKDEWEREGVELFGPHMLTWKFKCPGCGNIQSVEDFRKFKDQGATPNSAYQECIGRYTNGKSFTHMKSGEKGPCDYAAYGLFDICHTTVILEDGKKISVFEWGI